MNHNPSLLRICTALLLFFNTSHGATSCIKGIIEKPTRYNRALPISVQYCGKQDTTNVEGFYTIPCDNPVQIGKKQIAGVCPTTTPSLLICTRQLAHFESSNTLKKITHHEKESFRYFRQNSEGDWIEESLSKNDIPENCVHVILNPNLVARVENWDIELPPTIIKMPKIIINPAASDKELESAAAESAHHSLTLNHVHERVLSVNAIANTPAKNDIELKYSRG